MSDPFLFDMPNPLVAFYLGEAPDSAGRWLREMRAWKAERLENVHDYIQWFFPTRQPSQYNMNAPTLDDETVRVFRSDERLRAALLDSFRQMLDFYGFDHRMEDGRPVIETAADWLVRPTQWFRAGDPHRGGWFRAGDHNLLRITRILDCLSTLGLEAHARAFLAALDAACDAAPGTIPRLTREFWHSAVS